MNMPHECFDALMGTLERSCDLRGGDKVVACIVAAALAGKFDKRAGLTTLVLGEIGAKSSERFT